MKKRLAEVVVGILVPGIDLQRLPELSHRLVLLARMEQRRAEVAMGQGVVSSASQRVSPERFTILPVSSLHSRTENQGNQAHRGNATEHHPAMTPAGAPIRRSPSQQPIQPDLRQIRVTIRMRL